MKRSKIFWWLETIWYLLIIAAAGYGVCYGQFGRYGDIRGEINNRPLVVIDLTDGLVSHWRMDDTSGSRVDAHSTNDLPQFGGLGYTNSAIITNAANFVKASSQNLWLDASAADWKFGTNEAYTVSFWILFDDLTNYTSPAAYGSSTATMNYRFRILSSQLQYFVEDQFGATGTVNGPTGIVTATWYFVALWHDPDADEIGMRVDTTDYTTSWSSGTDGTSGAQGFRFGYLSGSSYFDGRIDSASHWNRVLTDAERSAVYNSGSGLDYDQF